MANSNLYDEFMKAIYKMDASRTPQENFIVPFPWKIVAEKLQSGEITYHNGCYWWYGIEVVPIPNMRLPKEDKQ